MSLFQRLLNNDFNFVTLSQQRRMRPEISKPIKYIYPQLKDHPVVENYPDVRGTATNVWFMDHQFPEKVDENTKSKFNEQEAELIIRFCIYLMSQKYQSSQITILTLYIGQLVLFGKLIRQKFSKEKFLNKIRIATVDNYQGEENDIVILSLVRNNAINDIGFLKVSNRQCVALSRAKQGMFIFGNASCLRKATQFVEQKSTDPLDLIWLHLLDYLEENQFIGKSLQLSCKKHKKITNIKRARDFDYIDGAGCDMPCGEQLNCGHICEKKCHPFETTKKDPTGHAKVWCYQICKKKMKQCGHLCQAKCQTCNEHGKGTYVWRCYEFTDLKLKCGHVNQIKCMYLNSQNQKCLKQCNQIRKDCGHECTMKCHGKIDSSDDIHKDIECTTICTKKLACGHEIMQQCYKFKNSNFKCKHYCTVTLGCGHQTQVKCCQKNDLKDIKCIGKDCSLLLNCGHQCKAKTCHFNNEGLHNNIVCKENKCIRPMNCEHPCNYRCQECKNGHQNCKVDVKMVLDCGHKQRIQCYQKQKQEEVKCDANSNVNLACGHQNQIKCYQMINIDQIECRSFCQEQMECGHQCKKNCHFDKKTDKSDHSNVHCVEKHCIRPMDCEHDCKYTCQDCTNGHKQCQQMIQHKLKCGHINEIKCYQKNDSQVECLVKKCGMQRRCGHVCDAKKCHFSQKSEANKDGHKFEPCYKICQRKSKCGHECTYLCHECEHGHKRCKELVSVQLDCGHYNMLPCGTKQRECKEMVSVQLKCGHFSNVQCKFKHDLSDVKCNQQCSQILKCQHKCQELCHQQNSLDVIEQIHNSQQCQQNCNKPLECGHICQSNCYQCKPQHSPCTQNCSGKLKCGHICQYKCFQCKEGHLQCNTPVQKVLPCGHQNEYKCYEQDNDNLECTAVCGIERPCQHICQGNCHFKTGHLNNFCEAICNKKLSCGHKCQQQCHLCKNGQHQKCSLLVPMTNNTCYHIGMYQCYLVQTQRTLQSLSNYMPSQNELKCNQLCQKVMECGHPCQNICVECLQDIQTNYFHSQCEQKCNKKLPTCHHKCQDICHGNSPCSPCNQTCEYQCSHIKCSKLCIQPCNPCQELCQFNCKHNKCNKTCGEICDKKPCHKGCDKKLSCNHHCVGLCTDLCPQVCLVKDCINYYEKTFFNIGYHQLNKQTKFIQLENCGHIIIHSQFQEMIDHYMKSEDSYSLCPIPQCLKLITNKRFVYYINQKQFQLNQQKELVRIHENQMRNQLINEISFFKIDIINCLYLNLQELIVTKLGLNQLFENLQYFFYNLQSVQQQKDLQVLSTLKFLGYLLIDFLKYIDKEQLTIYKYNQINRFDSLKIFEKQLKFDRINIKRIYVLEKIINAFKMKYIIQQKKEKNQLMIIWNHNIDLSKVMDDVLYNEVIQEIQQLNLLQIAKKQELPFS